MGVFIIYRVSENSVYNDRLIFKPCLLMMFVVVGGAGICWIILWLADGSWRFVIARRFSA